MRLNPFSKKVDKTGKRLTAIRPSYLQQHSYNTLMPEYPNVANKETYWKIYKNEAPIRAAINIITNAVCSTGYDVRTYKEGDVDMEDPKVKEINQWLSYPDQPVPFQNVMLSFVESLLIYDDSFMEVLPNKEGVKGWMYPLDTRDCEFYYTPTGSEVIGIKHLVASNTSPSGREERILNNQRYIHAAMHKQGSEHGLSLIESLVDNIDLYGATIDYANNLFDSNGVPALHVNLKTGSNADYEELVNVCKNTPQGATLVTHGDIETNPIGAKNNEIDYPNVHALAYQDVMSVFQIPPALMCVAGSSSSESSREETNSFSMNIRSIQQVINNAINRAIIKIFGEEYSEIRFELKPWINEKAQAAIDEIHIKNGIATPNDILKRDGKQTKEYGDYPYSMNFIPQLIGEVPWMAPATSQGNNNPAVDKTRENTGRGQPSNVERPSRQGKANVGKGIGIADDHSEALNEHLITTIDELQKTLQSLTTMITNEQIIKQRLLDQVADYDEVDVN